jgi:hypothetical protein
LQTGRGITILIAHQDEIGRHLHRLSSERVPEVIGNDYIVMGTTERAYWKEGFTKPHLPPETLANSAASTESRSSRFALWMICA